jgi:hypothetical protein
LKLGIKRNFELQIKTLQELPLEMQRSYSGSKEKRKEKEREYITVHHRLDALVQKLKCSSLCCIWLIEGLQLQMMSVAIAPAETLRVYKPITSMTLTKSMTSSR